MMIDVGGDRGRECELVYCECERFDGLFVSVLML